jgi:hypothetical protein
MPAANPATSIAMARAPPSETGAPLQDSTDKIER